MTKKVFPPLKEIRSKCQLELVYSDVCGPMSTPSLSGALYFVMFIDDYSWWCHTYVMKNKFEVLERFKEYQAKVENEFDTKIKCLRTDNGGEYTSKAFEDFLKSKGIKHELTVPYTPQQNGVSERMNRTLQDMARTQLAHAKLPRIFWAKAVNTATYI